jgi:hypothetical protein
MKLKKDKNKSQNVGIKMKNSSNIIFDSVNVSGYETGLDVEDSSNISTKRSSFEGSRKKRWWEKSWVQVLGIIGSIASIIGFIFYIFSK